MKGKFINIISVAIVVVLGIFAWNQFFRDDFDLPRNGDTTTETIFIKDGKIIDVIEKEDETIMDEKKQESKILKTKSIMVTDGVRHSVPLDEIIGGGPAKDGIPSIDNPKFISPDEADQFLGDDDPGIAFSRGTTHRFYPYQILVWHEIVNDTIDGERILVSYCPLCLTGFVSDPIVKGKRVEFGTSGKLWKSNLVMYDRLTDSLWSQVLGEAIVGEMTGTQLKTLPSDQVLYGNWKKEHPDGEVLSRDTGATRFYGSSPYGGYTNVTSFAIQMAGYNDTRLPRDAFVFGIIINGKAKAYLPEVVKEKGEIVDTFEGKTIVLRHEKSLDVVRVFEKQSDGTLERINPFSSFWFSWAAVHPDTDLYK